MTDTLSDQGLNPDLPSEASGPVTMLPRGYYGFIQSSERASDVIEHSVAAMYDDMVRDYNVEGDTSPLGATVQTLQNALDFSSRQQQQAYHVLMTDWQDERVSDAKLRQSTAKDASRYVYSRLGELEADVIESVLPRFEPGKALTGDASGDEATSVMDPQRYLDTTSEIRGELRRFDNGGYSGDRSNPPNVREYEYPGPPRDVKDVRYGVGKRFNRLAKLLGSRLG